MSRSRWLTLIPTLLLGCQGCALKPQDIHLDPPVNMQASSSLTPGKVVGVEANDLRKSRQLGIVGLVNSRHTAISSTEDAAPALFVRTAGALKRLGFSAKPAMDSDDRRLTVELASLSYRTVNTGTLTNEIEVSVQLNARARNMGEWLDRQFTVTQKKSVVAVPDADENSEFVNVAVAQALKDLLGDPALTELLSK